MVRGLIQHGHCPVLPGLHSVQATRTASRTPFPAWRALRCAKVGGCCARLTRGGAVNACCNGVACTARQPCRVSSQDARCPPCRPPADANEIRVSCHWPNHPRRIPACTAHGRWGRLLGVQRSRRVPEGPPWVLIHPTSPFLAAGAQGFRPAGPPPLCKPEPQRLTGKLRAVLHGGPRRACFVAQPAVVTPAPR